MRTVLSMLAMNCVSLVLAFGQCTTSAVVFYDTGNHCAGETVAFLSTGSGPGTTTLWRCPDDNCPPGFNANSPFPSFVSNSVDQNGIYTVTLTDSTNCVAKAHVMISLNPTPNVSIDHPAVFCEGKPVTGLAVVNNDPYLIHSPYTYMWSDGQMTQKYTGPGGISATAAAPFPENVLVTNVHGCSAYNGPAGFVFGTPKPSVTLSTNGTTKCEGQASVITATGSGTAGPYTYEWYFNEKLSGDTGSVLNATLEGKYRVRVTDAGGCKAKSNSRRITIVPNPKATITAGGPTTFCSGNLVELFAPTGSGYTYIWKTNGVNNGIISSSFIAAVPGSYSVKVFDGNCSSISNPVVVTVPCRLTGAAATATTNDNQGRLEAFPVPVQDILNLNTVGMTGMGTVMVMDALGRTVLSAPLNFDDLPHSIDMQSLNSGSYIVSLKSAGIARKVTVIKQ